MEKVSSLIDTPLGPMLAVADEEFLYGLEFWAGARAGAGEILGRTSPIVSIERELNEYFSGRLTHFQTPIALVGTAFQKLVWSELQKIPHGETRSYSELAQAIGRPTARRAAARANATNPLAIIVPCHRVIQADGQLGGYASGIDRKSWLLAHERRGASK